MPIPRKKLKIEILLHEHASYEILKKAGESNFADWTIDKLEGHCFGNDYGPNRQYSAETLIPLAEDYLNDLDVKKPFLRFGETGQHYANELFLSEPGFWGSRGAPFAWIELARAFSNDKLPMDKSDFIEKFNRLFKELTGIEVGTDEYVYVEKYAHGGMSSGRVGGVFALESLNVLLRRIDKYY